MSVTYTQANSIISAKFVTDWATAGRTEDLILPNDSYTPPDPPIASYVTYNLVGLRGDPESIGLSGNRRFDRDNQMVVEIYTPLANGDSYTGNLLAQTVIDIFESKKENEIWYKTAFSKEVGNIDDKWFKYIVYIDYTFTEIK
ncbi:MAG: hypothetical protein GY760_16005 [Deltaproteobacteria bacterium]|nr:hypothetical protein [Deltaproteobacteria bacterium]